MVNLIAGEKENEESFSKKEIKVVKVVGEIEVGKLMM